MSSAQKILLFSLVFAACLFRFFATYPPPLDYDPATIAVQASRIWREGETPIFWTGQPFMGTIGMYAEALLFQCFGMNSFTLSLFAWVMNSVWIVLTVLLAHRLFGFVTAMGTALLWVFPTQRLLYWASQARPDYEICFLLTPLVLLLTYQLIRRHQQKTVFGFLPFAFGLACGLGFWNNMALGPAILVCLALLLFHLGRNFWIRFLPFYSAGALLGLLPVVVYNFQTHFGIFHQAHLKGGIHLLSRIHSFCTLAFPDLWGMRCHHMESPLWRFILIFFMACMPVIYLTYVWQLYRRWKQKTDLLGDQLIVIFPLFLLVFTAFSNFGKRFASTVDPTLYITSIYTVLFLIPARTASFFGWRGRLICFLPFLIYIVHNLSHTANYPERFFKQWSKHGLDAVRHYPNPQNPFLPFCEKNGLEVGYVDSYIHQYLNIECLPKVAFVDPFQERHLPYAIQADAAKNIFWVLQEHDLKNQFDRLGCQYREAEVKGHTVFYEFKKERDFDCLASEFTFTASGPRLHASFANDRHIGTTWGASEDQEAFLQWEFPQPENLTRLTFIPKNSGSVPACFEIQTSEDGHVWKTQMQVQNAKTYFWSLYHPFVKRVKPRMETTLPEGVRTRHLKILIPKGNPCRLAEVYAYKAGAPPVLPQSTLDQEVEQIEKEIQTHFKDATLVGDHWWMNYFHGKGFKTHFLSNHSINKYGRKSPHLETPCPLAKGTSHCFIVSAAHADSVRGFLEKHRIVFVHKVFPSQALFYVAALPDSPSLHWDGLDLNEIESDPPQTGFAFPYPPLRALNPDAKTLSLRFGDEFSIQAAHLARTPEGFRFECEITPLSVLKKDFYLYLHFYDASGAFLFQGDFQMEHFGKPTSLWAPGRRVLLEQSIAIPGEHLGKTLEPRLGLWHPETQKQLRLEGSELRYFILRPDPE